AWAGKFVQWLRLKDASEDLDAEGLQDFLLEFLKMAEPDFEYQPYDGDSTVSGGTYLSRFSKVTGVATLMGDGGARWLDRTRTNALLAGTVVFDPELKTAMTQFATGRQGEKYEDAERILTQLFFNETDEVAAFLSGHVEPVVAQYRQRFIPSAP